MHTCVCTHTQKHTTTSHHHEGRKPLSEGWLFENLSRQIHAWNSGLLTTGSLSPIKPHPGLAVVWEVSPAPKGSWSPIPSRGRIPACVSPLGTPTCPLCSLKEPLGRGGPTSTHFHPFLWPASFSAASSSQRPPELQQHEQKILVHPRPVDRTVATTQVTSSKL